MHARHRRAAVGVRAGNCATQQTRKQRSTQQRRRGNKKPKKGAAAVAAVADRFVRELVLKNLTSQEHSAALEALFREATSEVAAAEAAEGRRQCKKPNKGAATADAAEAVAADFFSPLKILISKERIPRPRRPVSVRSRFFCAAV